MNLNEKHVVESFVYNLSLAFDYVSTCMRKQEKRKKEAQ